jgi:hypothetical protein
MKLKLNISDEDRLVTLQCLQSVYDGLKAERGSAQVFALEEGMSHLRFLIEMNEELDAKSTTLLYGTIEETIPVVVKAHQKEALARVKEAINRDGEAILKKFNRSRH